MWLIILQNIVKFRWQFGVSQHFCMDNSVHRLTFRGNLYDPSSEGLVLNLQLQYFSHLMWRTGSLEKTLMLGKIEGGRRRWQDEMVGCHHQLDEHEFEQAPEVSDGQRGLACCSPRGHKELDMTMWLSWTELRETRRLSSHGSYSVHACNNTNWLVWTCGVGWPQKCT